MLKTIWVFLPVVLHAAIPSDPGPRPGRPAAGVPLRELTSSQLAAFLAGQAKFAKVDDVADGLGPRFNLDSCGGCHAAPAIGGSSPSINPQFAAAVKNGANNQVPPFLAPNGPVRVARIRHNADGSRNGGVQALFTVEGRTDAPGCLAPQFDFASQAAANNLAYRIPTPVFGAGLIEAIPDQAILDNQARDARQKSQAGILGHPNHNGNDGSITRYGWKAQNKSLLIFSGEAYNVEQGVTNELFPNERYHEPRCALTPSIEDAPNLDSSTPVEAQSDIVLFGLFMRFSAPPAPPPPEAGGPGGALFAQVGCALCHTSTLTTGPSSVAALSTKPVTLFSDLLVHKMGAGLADDIVQGEAGPDEFRTAPLWGLGQRLFFLHDGRTSDLLEAIQAHRSPPSGRTPPSEANATVDAFNALTPDQKQAVLNFLRSL